MINRVLYQQFIAQPNDDCSRLTVTVVLDANVAFLALVVNDPLSYLGNDHRWRCDPRTDTCPPGTIRIRLSR